MASRNRRRIRLRTGELPVFLVTVSPKRGPAASPGLTLACRVKAGAPTRRPLPARWNSARCFSRPQGRGVGIDGSSKAFRAGTRGVEFRRRASCGRGRGGRSAPCGRRRSPCARENHAGVCARVCSADRCASQLKLPFASAVATRGAGQKNRGGKTRRVEGRLIGARGGGSQPGAMFQDDYHMPSAQFDTTNRRPGFSA
jgi:hypothetical protein